jgi:hypothetical protein
MSTPFIVPGKQLFQVNTGASFALEELGYAEDGFEYTEEEITEAVWNDQMGGRGTIPADFQRFGTIVRAQLVLNAINLTTWAKLEKGLNSSSRTAGTSAPADRGILIFQNSLAFAIRAVGPTTYIEFSQCRVQARTQGRQTKAARYVLAFEAYPKLSDGVTWTTGNNA